MPTHDYDATGSSDLSPLAYVAPTEKPLSLDHTFSDLLTASFQRLTEAPT